MYLQSPRWFERRNMIYTLAYFSDRMSNEERKAEILAEIPGLKDGEAYLLDGDFCDAVSWPVRILGHRSGARYTAPVDGLVRRYDWLPGESGRPDGKVSAILLVGIDAAGKVFRANLDRFTRAWPWIKATEKADKAIKSERLGFDKKSVGLFVGGRDKKRFPTVSVAPGAPVKKPADLDVEAELDAMAEIWKQQTL